MMLLKDLRRMLDVLPDNTLVIINGNYDCNIESIKAETDFDGIICDLRLTDGWSITKDSVLSEMFTALKAHAAHRK